jgi:hypothetical protein
MDMLDKSREHVRTKHQKIYTAEPVEALFSKPIITPVTLGKRLDVNYRTASRYLADLAKEKPKNNTIYPRLSMCNNQYTHLMITIRFVDTKSSAFSR